MRSRIAHTLMLIMVSILFGAMAFSKQECFAAPYKLLVFHAETAGWFTHPSIAAGIDMFNYMATDKGFGVDVGDDPAVFTDAKLKQYDAVVFLNTNGDFFNDNQKNAFQNFIRGGKGWLGTHCADNTLNDWDWYHEMIGSTYRGDSWDNNLPLVIVDTNNSVTKTLLPNPWVVAQQYRKNTWKFNETTPGFHVLIKVDPAFYAGHIGNGKNDWSNQSFVPFIYTHEFEGGRIWYGGMGHDNNSFKTTSAWYKLIYWGVEYAFGKKVKARPTPAAGQTSPAVSAAPMEVYRIDGTSVDFPGIKSGKQPSSLKPGLYIIKKNGNYRVESIVR